MARATDWSLMPAIVELMDRLETRLVKAPPVDGLQCVCLWLQLFGDGSGSLMCEYREARVGESPVDKAISVVSMKAHELDGFDSLEALHGLLVSRTCAVRRSVTPDERTVHDESD